MQVSTFVRGSVAAVAFAAMASASAAEYPIGKQNIQNGIELGAVYLQPITMEPEGMMRKASESDIHLEADIHAIANNPNGYAEADWRSNLVIKFELKKAGSTKLITGDMMPMVASDGPHYGDNVKLDGPGKYPLKLLVSTPSANQNDQLGRHV